jgi:hypothetical protein
MTGMAHRCLTVAIVVTVSLTVGCAGAMGARTAALSPACGTRDDGQGNDNLIALGNGSGNAGAANGSGNGQGDAVVLASGNGDCAHSGARPRPARNPHLRLTVREHNRTLAITVGLAAAATGVTRVTVSNPQQRVRTSGHGRRYTATVPYAGAWTVAVTFIGRGVWSRQRTRKTLTVT